jgi:mono/diheme cytochrome c family protein
MKFVAGFLTALAVSALAAILIIVSGVYDVAATLPHTGLGRVILNSTMRFSVRAHAGDDVQKTWSEDQVREGFKEYDGMCIICHGAPGKERSMIGKGLRPEPPNLAQTSEQWNNAQLFWIIKNRIKMTGMPAFGPTHQDDAIWNIVGFVRRLPRISAEGYQAMEKEIGTAPGQGHLMR